ncbi:hypothetical protein Tsubulata_041356, partial [Turnera subulata]
MSPQTQTLCFFSFTIFFSSLALRVDSARPAFACDSSSPRSYPFCNTSLPITQRATDLISRLTLDEKVSQLVNSAPPIPRLGIPGYEWWSEALHGVSPVGPGIHLNGTIKTATSFPQVILTAASFDANQWYRIGQVIGREARAYYNGGQASGMTFWAPNINIFRDPRWGRGQETPGEDPLVTGKYAVSYVRGIQGDSFEGGKLPGHLQASACCKHFTAYDLDNWNGMTRYVFDARVSMQDLADTYQPPFQSCVQQGKATGIMCAYNKVNGVPTCADYNLLSKTVRAQWGFDGYIVSDCDAVSIIHDAQGYAKSPEDAVHSKAAVEQKKLPESEIDRALNNLFSIRMRLGLFDGNPAGLPFGDIGPDQICTQEHQMLALEVARNGIVLLKNSAGILPLSKTKTASLGVMGPNANSASTLLGNYAGNPCKSVTPLHAFRSYIKNTIYFQGCDTAQCSSASVDEAVEIAKKVDHVIVIMGLDQTQEKEGLDRVNLGLPGRQQELVTKVAKASKNPIILVLISGGPVDISFAKNDKNIGGILWAGYPGEGGGIAVADIIFGEHNPGGRLPMTWYPQDFIRVAMTDMRMRADPSSGYPGRTYRFYRGASVFEFGYGLSYCKYWYQLKAVRRNKLYLNQSSSSIMHNSAADKVRYALVAELGARICEESKFQVRVGVENKGEMAGKHPVLLFASLGRHGKDKPRKQLIGFQSVILSAGEKAEIEFEVSPCEHLTRANEDGLMVMVEGKHFLMVGGDKRPISIITTRSVCESMKLHLTVLLVTSLLIFVAESSKPPFSCDSSYKSYPFCQTKLPIKQRVEDLVSRLSLDEKISQLVDTAPAITRLGIPAYEWWSEALHGVAFLPDVSQRQGIHFNGSIRSATSFPQVILTASSFDAHLWYRIAQVIGKEARAIYNAGQAIGMTFWAPNINIYRDPRWGRGQETPGEDPLVTGKYAVSYVRGVQGDSFEGGTLGEHLQASACCKHFTAYDLDNWKGTSRFKFDARVTLQDLADTYQPPFQSCIRDGKASGIMCAYNRVNGVPNCADYDLLTEKARGEWGFYGYITSDCDAVSIIHDEQGYAKLPEDAVADNYTKSAVKMKKISESDVDRALHNLFSIRMRLGLFNGNPSELPYGKIGPDQVCSQEHQALALEAARDGIVLLKNSDRLLPLSKLKTKSLAVIGPNADVWKTLLGNYAGPPCKTVTPLQGLKHYVKDTRYHPGCSTVECSSASINQAVKLAKRAEQVVLVMGLDQTQEREERDRDNLVLPGKQQQLITSVARAAKKPVVLVLLCGGPVDVSFAKYDRKIGSILWAGYPGEAGGTALAEIIFGDHNPGGRLPMTWYPQNFVQVFKFGYGLSYSNYSYEFASVTQAKLYLGSSSNEIVENTNIIRYHTVSELSTQLCEKSKLNVTVRVENQGDMAGKHPVLLFVRQGKHGNGRPMKNLVGFQSVMLNPGERTEIDYELRPCEHLSRANEQGLMVMEEGSQFLVVGDKEYLIAITF